MSITRSKSINTIYEECKDFDLVLVPDAPLASAINRRLDHPQFGPFAITPRRLAAERRERAEDRRAFLQLITETNLGWKEAAYSVEVILACWEFRGRIDAILDYDRFATDTIRTAIDAIAEMDTTARRLTEYSIDEDTSVVVVGETQLTELERSILPTEYTTIDLFTDDSFDYPSFHIHDSPAAIIDTVLETITAETAENVAVVHDRTSEYGSLIRSALEAADIPYHGGIDFTDKPHHRAFLQLLRSAHAGRDTRVGDVKPLLTQIGISIDVEHDEKRLFHFDDPAIDWFVDFSDSVHTYTFEDAIGVYEGATDSQLTAFRDELTQLGIEDALVSEAGLDRLEFYLQSYDVPVDHENDGVLLADATSAAHVDRPLVFYLGLDERWTHSSPRRPWVDQEQEFERNIRQFQLLLQNGQEQYYLVQDSAGGTPVTPCLYFEELLDEEFERFSDLDSVPRTRAFQPLQDGFEKEPVNAPTNEIETISQSSLNTYVNSPRDYFYSRLVQTPDKEHFKEGNLFHDFAEFYVNHPDQITADTLDEIATVILDEMKSYLRSVDYDVRRTKYRIGLQMIIEYLDTNPPQTDVFVTPDGGYGQNHFAEYFDQPVESPATEQWFENTDLGIKGKIDLVHSPTQLLDYKSGSKKSAKDAVKNSDIQSPTDKPNFQALLYLTHQRSEHPDQRLQFTFFHFLETLDDVVTGESNIDDCLTTVTYYPTKHEEYIATEAIFTELQEDAYGDCKKMFSKVDYETYQTFLDKHDFPTTRDKGELIESEFGHALTGRMVDAVGDYKYVKNGCKQALKYLLGIRNRNYFAEDLDAFETFIHDRLMELTDRHNGEERFPVDGPGEEPNYRYVDHRDCILEERSR